jgi:hypothetical protein
MMLRQNGAVKIGAVKDDEQAVPVFDSVTVIFRHGRSLPGGRN